MSRIRLVAVLTVIAALAVAGVAVAKVTKVTGGSTSITLSAATANALSTNGLTVTPIAPARSSGDTFTFPVLTGKFKAKLRGYVVHKGGFVFSNGTRSVRLRHLTAYSSRAGVAIWAQVGRVAKEVRCRTAKRCRVVFISRVAKIGRVTGVTVSGGKATGTIRLTTVSAGVINALAGKKIATAGVAIGTATLAPTL